MNVMQRLYALSLIVMLQNSFAMEYDDKNSPNSHYYTFEYFLSLAAMDAVLATDTGFQENNNNNNCPAEPTQPAYFSCNEDLSNDTLQPNDAHNTTIPQINNPAINTLDNANNLPAISAPHRKAIVEKPKSKSAPQPIVRAHRAKRGPYNSNNKQYPCQACGKFFSSPYFFSYHKDYCRGSGLNNPLKTPAQE